MRLATALHRPTHPAGAPIDHGFWTYVTSPLALIRRIAGGFDDTGTPAVAIAAPHGGPISVSSQASTPREPMDTLRPWDPELEIFRRDGRMIFRADVPGFEAADVTVELDRDRLTIAGDRRHAGSRRGSRAGATEPAFFREIPLIDGVDVSQCSASCKDGVLEIALPLPGDVTSRPQRITVT